MTADRHVDAGLMAVRTVVVQPTPDAVLALQQLQRRHFRAPISHIMSTELPHIASGESISRCPVSAAGGCAAGLSTVGRGRDGQHVVWPYADAIIA
jgi:hypothetical protein